MSTPKKLYQITFTAIRKLKAEMCIYPLESYPPFPPGRTEEFAKSVELVMAHTHAEAMRLLADRYEVVWIEECKDLGYRH